MLVPLYSFIFRDRTTRTHDVRIGYAVSTSHKKPCPLYNCVQWHLTSPDSTLSLVFQSTSLQQCGSRNGGFEETEWDC